MLSGTEARTATDVTGCHMNCAGPARGRRARHSACASSAHGILYPMPIGLLLAHLTIVLYVLYIVPTVYVPVYSTVVSTVRHKTRSCDRNEIRI